jgi:hypothetical protein
MRAQLHEPGWLTVLEGWALGGISARSIRPRLMVGRLNTALERRPRGSIGSMRGWRAQLCVAGEWSGAHNCHWKN